MRLPAALALTLSLCAGAPALASSSDSVIALFRHGEKPDAGLGMLSCKGLNRALALPERLAALAGRPHIAIAPNPSARKLDRGVEFDYNRPLLTLGPSAVAAGIPIEASIAWNDAPALASTLAQPRFSGKVAYVAWEHHLALAAARRLFKDLGADASALPSHWADDDFDTVYLITLSAPDGSGKRSASFAALREGLDAEISESCPGGAQAR